MHGIHRRNSAKQLHLTMIGRILIKGHEDFLPTCAGIADGVMAGSLRARQPNLFRGCVNLRCHISQWLSKCRAHVNDQRFSGQSHLFVLLKMYFRPRPTKHIRGRDGDGVHAAWDQFLVENRSGNGFGALGADCL
jgi:hypothetical protein